MENQNYNKISEALSSLYEASQALEGVSESEMKQFIKEAFKNKNPQDQKVLMGLQTFEQLAENARATTKKANFVKQLVLDHSNQMEEASSTTKQNLTSKLPDPLITKIGSFLDSTDIQSMNQTEQRFSKLLSFEKVIQNINENKIPIAKLMGDKGTQNFLERLAADSESGKKLKYLNLLTKGIDDDLDQDLLLDVIESCPNIETLVTNNLFNDAHLSENILEALANLERLNNLQLNDGMRSLEELLGLTETFGSKIKGIKLNINNEDEMEILTGLLYPPEGEGLHLDLENLDLKLDTDLNQFPPLPKGLKEISISSSAEVQGILDFSNKLPEGVERVELRLPNQQTFPDILPDSVKDLTLWSADSFQSFPNRFPENLEKLTLSTWTDNLAPIAAESFPAGFKTLVIKESKLTSLQSISLPNSLKTLHLDTNPQLQTLPEQLPDELTTFLIDNGRLIASNIKRLPSLPKNLSRLEVVNAAIARLPHNLPETLTNFNIVLCENLKYLPPARNFKNLKYFTLSNCEQIEEIPSPLSENLVDLDLSGCTNLKKIPKLPAGLESLSLIGVGPKLIGFDAKQLYKLNKLKILNLEGAQIGLIPNEIEALAKTLPNLKINLESEDPSNNWM